MPHRSSTKPNRTTRVKSEPRPTTQNAAESRYTVGLAPHVASKVEGQEQRKQEFFRRLKQNLVEDDPKQQDLVAEEFRTLILGR